MQKKKSPDIASAKASPKPASESARPGGFQPRPDQRGAKPDLLERRLAATREWLATAAENTFSIQLMGAENELQLVHHLNDMAKIVEINKVFLYRSVANRKPMLTVLYGSFGDRRAAEAELQKLHPSMKLYRPFVRTVRGLRAEIERQQRS